MDLLGKLVSGSGIFLSSDKLQAIEQLPFPSNAKELLSFLELMNYHIHHIKDYSKVLANLNSLAHADLFIWTRRHQACFQSLKQLASLAPVLWHSYPDGSFILDTDASGTQMGAALCRFKMMKYAHLLCQPCFT